MVTKHKQRWTFEVLGPSMIYNGFNRKSHATVSLRHHVTALISHLPFPCHQASQSFVLPPATKPVSHLPCPLPLHHRITVSVICLAPCHQTSQSFTLPSTSVSPHHRITAALCHHVTASPHQSVICLAPCHQTSQSFALPPATKPVSHLPCPLSPNQSVIWLALYHHITMSSWHYVTMSPLHRVTASPRQSVICLAPATKPVSHLPCPLPPNQSVIWLALYHCITASPRYCSTAALQHRGTAALHHHISQSFALPPATKPVSHLPCPLLPNQSVIWLAPYHHVTVSLHHHITVSLHYCITTSPHHHMRFSPPHGYESDWLILPNTVLIG